MTKHVCSSILAMSLVFSTLAHPCRAQGQAGPDTAAAIDLPLDSEDQTGAQLRLYLANRDEGGAVIERAAVVGSRRRGAEIQELEELRGRPFSPAAFRTPRNYLEDVNFDGFPDLVLKLDINEPDPRSIVYLYDQGARKFAHNRELSNLPNLEVLSKRHRRLRSSTGGRLDSERTFEWNGSELRPLTERIRTAEKCESTSAACRCPYQVVERWFRVREGSREEIEVRKFCP